MIKHSNVGFHKPITTTVQKQIDLKKNPNPNIGDGYCLSKDPLFVSLRSPDTLQGPNGPKDDDAAP
jgi:hypothetical protein